MTMQLGGVRAGANAQGVVLMAAAVQTATGASGQMGGLGWAKSITAQLNVTAVATNGSDTLDVTVQTTVDGANWIDVIHFTQIVGSGSAVIRVAKAINAAAQAEVVATGASADTARNLFGDSWRVSYVIVNGDAASFTFGVTANFQ